MAQAPSFSPIGEMVSGGQSAQFMVHKYGGYAEREGRRERMRETALAALQAVVAEPPRVSPRRLRRCLSRTLKIGTAIAPVPKKIYYEPQNRGAVAQAAPATSRAQDDLRLLRFHNGFWLQNDWSATDARRVGDRKLTRLRAKLGVRYVLEGSVRRTGDQVRVNVQLVDAESGAHLWADRLDLDRANLAKAQDEITSRLARTLDLELVRAVGQQIEQEKAVNPDARDFIMRGWALWYRPRSAANRQEAQRAFERALDIDPGSIDARIGIATILTGNISDGWSRSVQADQERAEQLLLEIFEQDANRSMAHSARGLLRRSQNRLAEARAAYEAAIALDRNDARAIYQLGQTLNYLGQPEAAIHQIEKAIRLNLRDPNLASYYYALGHCHLVLGHVDQATDLLRKARAGNPRHWYIHVVLAGALGLGGELDEARTALAEGIKLEPRISSLGQWRALRPWATHPDYMARAEGTLYAGLRRAGLSD